MLSFGGVLLSALALTIACSDGSITGPELAAPKAGKASVALQTRIVYLGAPRAAAINFIRAAVYDTTTGERLASIEQALDPSKNTFDFYFPVPLPLGSAVPAKLTLELANKTATSEVVEYSGRRTDLILKSGDFKQIEIDIYPGPLSNFDVTGVAIAKPIAGRIEGDSVKASAAIAGNATGARIAWTSLDDSIATVDAGGMIHAVLPGIARIVAAVAEHADTAAATVLVRRAAVRLTPAAIDLIHAGDTATFAAIVLDPRGNPIPGDTVTWSIADTSFAQMIGPGQFVARRVGQSAINVAAKEAPLVTAAGSLTTNTAGAVSVATSTLTAAPASITADGSSTAAVVIRLGDANGNPVKRTETPVVLNKVGSGALSAVTDNGDGSYSAVLTAPTAVGSASISASIGTAVLGPAIVTYVAGAPSRYIVTVTPTSASPGSPVTVSVRLADAQGNLISLAGRVITWTDAASGGAFSASTSSTDSSGAATVTFTPGAGTNVSHVISASDDGTPAAKGSSAPFATTVTGTPVAAAPLPATNLKIATPAAGAVSGAAFTTQPSIEVTDSTGARVSSDTTSVVTLSVSSGASVVGTSTSAAKNGVATFATVGIAGIAGTTYSLTFTSGALASVKQGIVPTAGQPTQLALTTAAAGATSGSAFTTQPVITIRDAQGNTVTSGTGTVVTMTVSAGGTVVGTATSTAVNGIATFTNVGISGTDGTAYTITFASAALAPATQTVTASAAPVVIGPASALAVARAAAGATSGNAFTTQPAIAIRDANGNTVSSDNTTVVTMTVSSGATIVGTATATAANGVATFSSVGLSGTAGSTATLTFSSGALPAVTSTVGISAGAASKLSIGAAASGSVSGAAFATQPAISVTDASGNTVISDNATVVTMTASSGATIVGTATATAVNGIATFAGIGITGTAGTSYTLTFSAPALTAATQSITPSAGAASQLILTTSAAGASSGSAFSTQPAVTIRDASGNTVVSNNSTTVTMTVSSGATVVGTATATAVNGVATFAGVGISGTAGTSYTLTFSAASISSATQSITPTAGAASQLALTTSAAGAPSGAPFITQPALTLRDAAGNTATSDNSTVVTMTVSSGASIVGTATATAAAGVATFSTVGLTGTTGVAYTITFAASGLSSASQSITVSASQGSVSIATAAAGSASGIAFTTQPVVHILDGSGNAVAGDNTTVVTMTVSTGATIVGSASATASSGVATFSNVGISGIAGTSYTLTFAATGLSSATQSIIPTAGTAATLVLTTSAAGAASGAAFTTQPVVAIRDAMGNTVTSDNSSAVTMTVNLSGTIVGTATVTAANGVATFSNVGISGTAGTAYTLTFAKSGLTSATQSITPTAGALDHFTITATDGSAVGTQTVNVAASIRITARDASDNLVTGFTGSAVITASGATLSGAPLTSSAFVSGVLASQAVTLTSTGTTVTLAATASGKTGTSATFAVTNQTLSITTQPAGASSGAVMTTVPVIQLRNNGTNQALAGVVLTTSVATQPSTGATLAISGGAASATTDASGVATFTNLSLSGVIGAYTLKFTAPGYASATSNSLSLTAGVATQVVMSGPDSVVSQAVSEPFTLTLKDGAGNTTTAGAGGVTIVMSTNGTGTFYSDANGTTALPSNQITIASGSSTATFYYQDTQVLASSVTRTITGARVGGGLVSGTFSIYVKSGATASQRLVCKTRGNPNNSSSFVDITGCAAIASGHRLLVGVSVAGAVTMVADSSGWSLVTSAQSVGSGSEKLTMAVYQKTATSGDNATSSYRFHWTGSGSTNLKNVASLVVYKNATVDVAVTKSSTTGGTTVSTNPVTPTTNSTTAVYWFGLSSGDSNADILSNWTISKDLYTETLAAGNSNSASILASDVDRQTLSTYQSRSAANSALTSSSAWIGIVTVLK